MSVRKRINTSKQREDEAAALPAAPIANRNNSSNSNNNINPGGSKKQRSNNPNLHVNINVSNDALYVPGLEEAFGSENPRNKMIIEETLKRYPTGTKLYDMSSGQGPDGPVTYSFQIIESINVPGKRIIQRTKTEVSGWEAWNHSSSVGSLNNPHQFEAEPYSSQKSRINALLSRNNVEIGHYVQGVHPAQGDEEELYIVVENPSTYLKELKNIKEHNASNGGRRRTRRRKHRKQRKTHRKQRK